MISKKDILVFAKEVTRRTKGTKNAKAIHPRRDWLLGVLVWFCSIVAGSFYGMNQYHYYDVIETTVSPDVPEITNYEEEIAATALERLTERQLRFDELVSDTPVVTLALPATTTQSDEEPVTVPLPPALPDRPQVE